MVYNFASLPRWNSQFQPPEPRIVNDRGYDVRATRLSPARRDAAYRRANAKIGNGQFWFPLFIHDIEIDIALSGTMAQSRSTRDFYPRNFVQPNFILSGQALDQQDYGVMADFMHYLQQHMLQNPTNLLAQVVITGSNGLFGRRNTGLSVSFEAAKFLNLPSYHNLNQMLKGSHMPIIAQGYIGSIKRAHSQGVYAPPYDFQFIVADMIQGPYSEQMAKARKQVTWVDMLNSTSNITNTPALIKEANQIVKEAEKPENILATINSSGPTGGGSSSGGSGKSGTYTASTYTGSGGGSCGLGLGMTFAELVGDNFASVGTVTQQNATALGGLKCGAKIKVTYKGKTVTLTKTDIGRGGNGLGGHPRAIDLYSDAANALNFSGLDNVQVEIL